MITNTNIKTSFGRPVTAPCLIPVHHASTPTCINDPFMVDGKEYRVTALSFGTPHGAVFVSDVDKVDVSSLGASLGTHVLFPKGADIVFIEIFDSDSIRVRLWQRDKGESSFSEEAVCVAATASMMLHKIHSHRVKVVMAGISCLVNWDRMGEVILENTF